MAPFLRYFEPTPVEPLRLPLVGLIDKYLPCMEDRVSDLWIPF
jgi:hypothetical protein